MASLEMQVTTVGLQAVTAAVANGTTFQPDEVEIGGGRYTPAAGRTALESPFNPVRQFTSNFAGVVTGSTTAEFSFQDVSMDGYDLGEIGLFGRPPYH